MTEVQSGWFPTILKDALSHQKVIHETNLCLVTVQRTIYSVGAYHYALLTSVLIDRLPATGSNRCKVGCCSHSFSCVRPVIR